MSYVNKAQSEPELGAIRHSVRQGTPYGGEKWITQSAVPLGLKHTLPPQRPAQIQ